ncbi:MAG: hypothetical protein IT374_10410 [Polyangiaceae bacterium]|nr:hypothetical protein [Polyangiaceae bacterium]
MLLAPLAALLDDLAQLDGVEARWRAVDAPIAEAFESDQWRESNVLEPSITGDARGVRGYRFSYGFPRYRADPARSQRFAVGVARVVGGEAQDAARRVARAAAAPCVEQPIVGFSHDTDGAPVLKLYLLFGDGHDSAARRLAASVLGSERAVAAVEGGLHLLGLDVGAGGLRRAKLYGLHRALPWAEVASRLGLDASALPVETVHDALLIHEVRSPEDLTSTPRAVDLPLRAQRATFAELAPHLARIHPGAVERYQELAVRHPLRMRRVSIGAHASPKLNLYYELDAARARRPAGA